MNQLERGLRSIEKIVAHLRRYPDQWVDDWNVAGLGEDLATALKDVEASHNPSCPESDLLMAKQGVSEEERAIGVYQEMIEKATDPKFKEVLAHIRDEEIEHADEFREVVARLEGRRAGHGH